MPQGFGELLQARRKQEPQMQQKAEINLCAVLAMAPCPGHPSFPLSMLAKLVELYRLFSLANMGGNDHQQSPKRWMKQMGGRWLHRRCKTVALPMEPTCI